MGWQPRVQAGLRVQRRALVLPGQSLLAHQTPPPVVWPRLAGSLTVKQSWPDSQLRLKTESILHLKSP